MTETQYKELEARIVSMSSAQLRETLRDVVYTLWPRGTQREWDADTLDRIAQLLHRRGLNPDA